MNTLAPLATKTPIVATFDAFALRETARHVRETYDWHAATYIEQPAIATLRQSFITGIQESRTPKACLVAPFGYGKTATAIGIWKACQDAKLLAVPPISCSSFTDLARALYDWLRFVLPNQNEVITSAHDTFLARSSASLARRDEREFGIPFEQALRAIQDKLERGYLDFEDVSVNLLAFIERATALAQTAGYGGLVLFVDEFQQLLGNASKGVLVALRQLVWGLRTREIPFGLLLTMDPDTERTLADRAGDILHRIKDDGLYLDMRHIYDRDFPARLWAQYVKTLHLTDTARGAIDRPALEALGQLCERHDLSNGPRTVINVLQTVATRYRPGITYTPITLINDLLSGAIRFDGDKGLIPSVVGELLSFPYFQRAPLRAQALKLLAAFPRGCSQIIAQRYGVEAAWAEIGDDLRGEIVTELEEGLALVELQRVARPANRLNVLLRQYWMQLTDRQLWDEEAARTFAKVVFPLLFPARTTDLNGWDFVEPVQLAAWGGYVGIIEGTTSPRYPLRRVALFVTTDEFPAHSLENVDFQLCFRLDYDPEAASELKILVPERAWGFRLAMARPSQAALPGSIAWIEHYLSPQPLSPAVVLSLLYHLQQAALSEKETERDQLRLEDATVRLQGWLLSELFPPELFQCAEQEVFQAGEGALREFLFQVSRRKWASYQTLVVHPHWRQLLADYLAALRCSTPEERQGRVPVTGSKSAVAARFGQTRHAGFKSRARQYGSLLQLEHWRGAEVSLRLMPHPAEIQVASWVREAGTAEIEEIYRKLRSTGFASAEVDLLLQLAETRGLVERSETTLQVPLIPTAAELSARAQEFRERYATLVEASPTILKDLSAIIEGERLEDESQIAWRLAQIEEQLLQAEAVEREATIAQQAIFQRELRNLLPQLAFLLHTVPEAEIRLANQLKKAGALLEKRQRALQQSIEALLSPEVFPSREKVQEIAASVQHWKEQVDHLGSWRELATRFNSLERALVRLAGENQRLSQLLEQVSGLLADARAILAQEGLSALSEVERLSVSLEAFQQQFNSMEIERTEAYDCIAVRLTAEINDLIQYPTPRPFPIYDPREDEVSFYRLRLWASQIVSQAVALFHLDLIEAPSAALLRKSVQEISALAANPTWLLEERNFTLKSEAVKAIQSLQRQLGECRNTRPTMTSKFAAALQSVLAVYSPDPVDLTLILERLGDPGDHPEVLSALLQLHQEGVLQLTITLSRAQ